MPTPTRLRLAQPEPLCFLGVPSAARRPDQARVAVIPAPFDQTTSYLPGTRFGPRAILEASCQVELYDEELDCEPFQAGIATLSAITVDPADLAAGLRRLQAVVDSLAVKGILPLTLGGEHSLTLAPVTALRDRYPDLCVLQLDAHMDLRDVYQGTPLSHACVMRRIRDLGAASVAVGIRSVSREEADYVHAERAPVFLAREIRASGLPMDAIIASLGNPVYVTVDLDAFDPAFVPAVGTPEPGGLTWTEGLALLRAVCERRQVVGADIVELCPMPGQITSDFFAARLAYKLIAYLTSSGAATPSSHGGGADSRVGSSRPSLKRRSRTPSPARRASRPAKR